MMEKQIINNFDFEKELKINNSYKFIHYKKYKKKFQSFVNLFKKLLMKKIHTQVNLCEQDVTKC